MTAQGDETDPLPLSALQHWAYCPRQCGLIHARALTRAALDLAASLRALRSAAHLDVVRGIEGEAARTYFTALNLLVRADLRATFTMDGRSRRPPRDRVNALLSFFYSMWMNDCRSACEAAGLDPQIGSCTRCVPAAQRWRWI